MLTKKDQQRARVIFDLLKNASSRAVVEEFLKGESIPHTAATWDDLYTKRIFPALEEGQLTLSKLRDVLRDADENGRQHIFVYSCSVANAKLLLGSKRIDAILKELGVDHVATAPLDLDMPSSPQFVDFRHTVRTSDGAKGFIVKIVETRETTKFIGITHDAQNSRMSKVYSVTKKRAVSTATLYDTGELELRIASQDNSTKYLKNVSALWSRINKIFPKSVFKEVSLSKAKKKIWADRKNLSATVRYSTSLARNEFGYKMQISGTLQGDNLSTDKGSEKAMDSFLSAQGEVSGSNIYFIIPGSATLREIHTLLSGEDNEFAIPVACTAMEYEYVRGQIFQLNS